MTKFNLFGIEHWFWNLDNNHPINEVYVVQYFYLWHMRQSSLSNERRSLYSIETYVKPYEDPLDIHGVAPKSINPNTIDKHVVINMLTQSQQRNNVYVRRCV